MKPIDRLRTPSLACFLFLGALAAPAAAAAASAPGDDRTERTDAIFAKWTAPGSPGCSVAVRRGDEILHGAGYGLASLEQEKAITPETIFHVASVSKQVVAFAICLLAADGTLSLDDDVRTHVPEVPDFGTPITLRHLIHHTSGIRDQWDLLVLAGWRMEDVITLEDVMDLVAAQRELNFEPGMRQLYSNTGYTLLALVVERAGGKSLDEFCRERIFAPLGMDSTHFHTDHRLVVVGRADCYQNRRGDFERSVLSYAVAGATSLFTTAPDLVRFDGNYTTGLVGGPAVIAMMEQRTTLPGRAEPHPYGFALNHGTHAGRPTRAHAGGDAGYRAYLLRFPDEDLSVAILANLPMPVGTLAFEVADIWLDESPVTTDATIAVASESTDETPVTPEAADEVELTPERLARLAGWYSSAQPPLALELRVDGNGLVGYIGGQRQARIVPTAEDRFTVTAEPGGSVVFSETESTKSCVVTLNGGGTFALQAVAPPDPESLEALVGVYESPELEVKYRLSLVDGALHITRRKRGTQPLQWVGPDRYASDLRLDVARDEAGAVTGFHVSTGRVLRLWFEKAE